MKQYSAVTFLCRFTFAFIVAVGAISLSSCHYDSDEPDTIVPEVPDSVGPDKPDTTSSRKTLFMYYPWSTNYNPQIQISVVSGTKRSIFRQKNKTKRSKKRLHTTLIKPEQKVNEDLCSGFIVS